MQNFNKRSNFKNTMLAGDLSIRDPSVTSLAIYSLSIEIPLLQRCCFFHVNRLTVSHPPSFLFLPPTWIPCCSHARTSCFQKLWNTPGNAFSRLTDRLIRVERLKLLISRARFEANLEQRHWFFLPQRSLIYKRPTSRRFTADGPLSQPGQERPSNSHGNLWLAMLQEARYQPSGPSLVSVAQKSTSGKSVWFYFCLC